MTLRLSTVVANKRGPNSCSSIGNLDSDTLVLLMMTQEERD